MSATTAPADDRPTALEWAGWGLLAAITLATALLAIVRPTDPSQIVHEIRLAAGADRYQAALDEGDRLYATAVAELRLVDADDDEGRVAVYRLFDGAIERFALARAEAEDAHEDREAQIRIARAYFAWARGLYRDATGEWYQPNDRDTLRRARGLVNRGLALPDIEPRTRSALEDLGTRIDRAITPWPIL